MPPSISVAVMAHRKRERWIPELLAALDHPAEVVWDRINDRHDTGARSLEAFDPAATHHLVVQDDAVACRDLVAGVTEAVKVSGDRIVGLYVGNVRPIAGRVDAHLAASVAAGSPWMEMSGPLWGVALVVPTPCIPELLDYYRASTVENYDRRIERWAQAAGVGCWYTVPSLVDHRTSAENPSLISGRTSINRRARWFVGADSSALDIDWTRAAPPEPMRIPAAPTTTRRWRRTDGRTRTTTVGSQLDRAHRTSSDWEEVIPVGVDRE